MILFSFCSSGRDAKKIGILVGLVLLVGVSCLFVAGAGIPGKVIYQGVFVLSLMIAAFYTVRYLLLSYCYEVREEDGRCYLFVVQKQGKRQNTLLCLALDGVAEVRYCERKNRPSRKEFSKELRYTTALFSPTVALFSERENEVTLLRIEADKAFFEALSALHDRITAKNDYDPADKDEA